MQQTNLALWTAKIAKPLSDMVTVGQLKTVAAPESSGPEDSSTDTGSPSGIATNVSLSETLGGEEDINSAGDSSNHPPKEDVDIQDYNASSKGSRRGSTFGW